MFLPIACVEFGVWIIAEFGKYRCETLFKRFAFIGCGHFSGLIRLPTLASGTAPYGRARCQPQRGPFHELTRPRSAWVHRVSSRRLVRAYHRRLICHSSTARVSAVWTGRPCLGTRKLHEFLECRAVFAEDNFKLFG